LLRKAGQDAPDHFFEGAEKLLSIWFTTEDGNGEDHGDLKKIPRKKWDELVRSVDAEILSEKGRRICQESTRKSKVHLIEY
jgi:hypothetical protein